MLSKVPGINVCFQMLMWGLAVGVTWRENVFFIVSSCLALFFVCELVRCNFLYICVYMHMNKTTASRFYFGARFGLEKVALGRNHYSGPDPRHLVNFTSSVVCADAFGGMRGQSGLRPPAQFNVLETSGALSTVCLPCFLCLLCMSCLLRVLCFLCFLCLLC